MDRFTRRCLLCLILSGLVLSDVLAQEAPPRGQAAKSQTLEADRATTEWPPVTESSLPLPSALEPKPIPLQRQSRSGSNPSEPTSGQPSRGSPMGTILGALGFVLLLLLGCAKLFLKQSPLAMPGLPRDAIEVLGRRTVDPRNTIYVVKVGGKVLLLGGSVNGLAPLSEITDPIEVATLINTCRAVDAPRRSLADWWREKWQRRPQPDPRPFSERFGEQLFQQAEQGGQRLTSLTVRGPQEGSRHA